MKSEARSPILQWGPYLWADGTTPRKPDGLVSKREDLATDGVHPTLSGREKVAKLLLDFFTKDALANGWFAPRVMGGGVYPRRTSNHETRRG